MEKGIDMDMGRGGCALFTTWTWEGGQLAIVVRLRPQGVSFMSVLVYFGSLLLRM